jgi:hypothetical protein
MTVAAGIHARILQYLAARNTKEAVADALSKHPYEAFRAILGYQGPYPESVHPMDAHTDHLPALLAALLTRAPRLLIGPRPAKTPPRPYMLIAAAIISNDSRFAATILSGLKDRSIYVKLAVVNGITRCRFLQTPDVKRQLQALTTMKSIAKDAYTLDRIREAVEIIDRHA